MKTSLEYAQDIEHTLQNYLHHSVELEMQNAQLKQAFRLLWQKMGALDESGNALASFTNNEAIALRSIVKNANIFPTKANEQEEQQ